MGVVLIGYRGSGKTTVGRLLAKRLNLEFIDCDDRIIAKTGQSIREIFAGAGEAEFRKIETSVIAELRDTKNCVIAVGGGALIQEENRRHFAHGDHRLIYLRCHPRELLKRIAADPATSNNRPDLTDLGGGIEEITAVLSHREPIYKAAMSAELDVTHLTPDQVVDRIQRLL